MSEQTNPYSNGSTTPDGEEILAPLPNDGGLIDADAWMHEEVNRAPKAEPQYSLETGEVEKVIVNPNTAPVSDVPTWAGGGAPWNNGPEPIADSDITLPADEVEPQMPARRSVFSDINSESSANAHTTNATNATNHANSPAENAPIANLSTESTSMAEPSETIHQPAPMPTVPTFTPPVNASVDTSTPLSSSPEPVVSENPGVTDLVSPTSATPTEQAADEFTSTENAHDRAKTQDDSPAIPTVDEDEVVYHESFDETVYHSNADDSASENAGMENENPEIEHTKVAMAVTPDNLSENNAPRSETSEAFPATETASTPAASPAVETVPTPEPEPVYGINPDALIAKNTNATWPTPEPAQVEAETAPSIAAETETAAESTIEAPVVPTAEKDADTAQFAKNTTDNWSEDSPAEDPFSVDLKPKSRVGAHLWGLLLALLLPPILWYLVSDGATRLTSQETQPWEAGIDWIALLELIGSILLVVVIIIVASASSAGVITFGVIFTLIGLVPIILPSISYNFLTSFFAPLNNLGNFGENLNHYLMTTLFNGTFIFFGLFLLAIGVVSHRARRAGRLEGELKQKIAYTEKAKAES